MSDNGNRAERQLLNTMAYQPPLPATTALTLLCDLAQSLVAIYTTSADRTHEVHARLVHLAQLCMDASDRLEERNGRRFEWESNRRKWDRLHARLWEAERRADLAIARAQAYRAGRLDERDV